MHTYTCIHATPNTACTHLPEAGGSQPVSVQPCADLFAVGEDEERGSVPALLQAFVVLVEVDNLGAGKEEGGTEEERGQITQ